MKKATPSTQPRTCVHVVPEHFAREQLGDRFEERRRAGQDRLRRAQEFEARRKEDGKLAERLRREPLGTLEEAGILEPQDVLEVTYEARDYPNLKDSHLADAPFGEPFCYIICQFQLEWVCRPVPPGGLLEICEQRLRLRCRWICR